MRITRLILIWLLGLLFIGSSSFAFSRRVNQMPNGSKFSCSNCHLNAGGGGTRNAYGEEIRNYLNNNGDLVWDADLAGLDSDGDGASNGSELQDPTGSWQSGQAQPGDYNLVTNPGDAASTPATRIDASTDQNNPQAIYLAQNYPNPFNAGTVIRFHLPQSTSAILTIYSLTGQYVRQFVRGKHDSGDDSIIWNGLDDTGNSLASGIYIYELRTPDFVQRKKMILLR